MAQTCDPLQYCEVFDEPKESLTRTSSGSYKHLVTMIYIAFWPGVNFQQGPEMDIRIRSGFLSKSTFGVGMMMGA